MTTPISSADLVACPHGHPYPNLCEECHLFDERKQDLPTRLMHAGNMLASPNNSREKQKYAMRAIDEAATLIREQAAELELAGYERSSAAEAATVLLKALNWSSGGLAAAAHEIVAELAKRDADAERYRWLRAQGEGVEFRDHEGRWRSDQPDGQALDEAIDDALKANLP